MHRQVHPSVAAALCLGLGVWGGKKLMNVAAEMIAEQVRDNPVILQHIGNIEKAELDLGATGATGGDETLVLRLTGTKGNGRLTAETQDDGQGNLEVVAGKLRLDDGQTVVDLNIGGEPSEPETSAGDQAAEPEAPGDGG